MNDERLFLDVNIPMYAAGSAHQYKEACVRILREIADGSLSVVIDTEIIQEVLYRYGARREWDLAERMASGLIELIPTILPVTLKDMRVAVRLFAEHAANGAKSRDVIHAAVMENHGLTQIISTDKHFDRLPDIVRLDPLDLF